MRLEDNCIVGGKKKKKIGKRITKKVKQYVKSRNRTQLPYSSDVEKIIRRRQGKLIDDQSIPIPVTIVPRRDLSGKISEFLKIQDLIQPAATVEAPAAAPAAAPVARIAAPAAAPVARIAAPAVAIKSKRRTKEMIDNDKIILSKLRDFLTKTDDEKRRIILGISENDRNSIREYLYREPKPAGYNKIRNSVEEIERWLSPPPLVEAVDEGIRIGLTRDDLVNISNEMAPRLGVSPEDIMGHVNAAMPREEEEPVPRPRRRN